MQIKKERWQGAHNEKITYAWRRKIKDQVLRAQSDGDNGRLPGMQNPKETEANI